MASFSISSSNITRVEDAESTSGWTNADGTEVDFVYQGTYCIASLIKTSREEIVYTHGTTYDMSTNDYVVIFKVIATNSAALDGNGLEVVVGSDASNENWYYMFLDPTDTDRPYPVAGGWQIVCVQPNVAFWYANTVTGVNDGVQNGTPALGSVDFFGMAGDASNTAKAANMGIDAIDIVISGNGLVGTGGDGVDTDGTFQDFSDADYNSATTGRWGIVAEQAGILYVNGKLIVGSATETDFTDSNQTLVFPHHRVDSGYSGLEFDLSNSNSVMSVTDCTFIGRGDSYNSGAIDTRPDYTVTGTSGALTMSGCTFNSYRLVTLTTGSDVTACSFIGGAESVDLNGADISGSAFSGGDLAADDSYIDWDTNADPDGELDDLSFTMGANSHHAIELGTNTPSSITLRGWTVSGFSAANGNNDSVIYNNSGKAITVNVYDNSGTISYKNGTSATTDVVVQPVSLSIHVEDPDGNDLSGARVWVPVTSTAGGYPFEGSVTNLTRSGTTATATHTAHGLATNDFVDINGATDEDTWNGTYQITVSDADTYTYTMAGTPTAASASGTITSTFVVISGTTDASGDISKSKSYSANQPISGRVRYSSDPYYKTAPVSGEIDSTNGLLVNIQMIADE